MPKHVEICGRFLLITLGHIWSRPFQDGFRWSPSGSWRQEIFPTLLHWMLIFFASHPTEQAEIWPMTQPMVGSPIEGSDFKWEKSIGLAFFSRWYFHDSKNIKNMVQEVLLLKKGKQPSWIHAVHHASSSMLTIPFGKDWHCTPFSPWVIPLTKQVISLQISGLFCVAGLTPCLHHCSRVTLC